uniref:GABA type A receptor associated protein like 1 n=1 Tax=Molossus molossus TaxID=27622 RepID=A0A7J8FY99_MOLMO|nr:GABA type A receptor associated protein like 1 [Molossus molossus]
MRTTMRKTTSCTWPTVMRVCMGSEWWRPADGSTWTRGWGVCGTGDEKAGLPHGGDRRPRPLETLHRIHRHHSFTCSIDVFCCFLGPGRKHVRTELMD